MTAPDLDVIKDIPGYKVILKAVLKSQIQQLVSQLAANTDEESVILTASVADGTISHLGSDSGKEFLDNHEDIKSQFLGFCLKSHHKKKQQEEAEKRQQIISQTLARSISPGHYSPQGSRGEGKTYPFAHSHISSGVRHQPYNVTSPRKAPQRSQQPGVAFSTASAASTLIGGASVKLEPDSNVDNTDLSVNESVDQDSSQNPSQSSGIPTVVGENETLSLTSVPQNHPDLNSETEQPENSDGDQNIKLEAVSESEFDLEITGVEPGRTEDWDPNVSMGTTFDPAGVAGDIGGQGNRPCGILQNVLQDVLATKQAKLYQCVECQKLFATKQTYERHMLRHSGSKPYRCAFCDHRTARKDSLKLHEVLVHKKTQVLDSFDENGS